MDVDRLRELLDRRDKAPIGVELEAARDELWVAASIALPALLDALDAERAARVAAEARRDDAERLFARAVCRADDAEGERDALRAEVARLTEAFAALRAKAGD